MSISIERSVVERIKQLEPYRIVKDGRVDSEDRVSCDREKEWITSWGGITPSDPLHLSRMSYFLSDTHWLSFSVDSDNIP